MTWVRIDDDLFTHPKILDAWERDRASIGLWAFAAAHSGKYLLDGAIPARFVASFFATPAQTRHATKALVDARLWVPNGTGWTIHDWTEYNPPRERVLARRRADSERKRGGK